MAKHKAPTEVTLVPTVEKQGLWLWVEHYWKIATALAVLVAGAILVLQYVSSQERAAELESWRALNSVVQDQLVARTAESYYVAPVGEPPALDGVARELEDSVAAPWALASLAWSNGQQQRYPEAEKALGDLRSNHPSNFLAEERFRFGDEATPRTLAEQLNRNYQDWSKWRAEHPGLFQNPELPPDAPSVSIRTDKGNILIGLYQDRAPRHAANFLKLAGEGYYDGTVFHRIVRGYVIQGGDPNSREGDPGTWGQGGPAEGLEPEPNDLRHFEGFLAAAKSDPKGKSSGSQFYLTVGTPHDLDEDYTVFGKVLEGMDVVRAISEGEIAEGTQDRPKEPVRILGTGAVQVEQGK